MFYSISKNGEALLDQGWHRRGGQGCPTLCLPFKKMATFKPRYEHTSDSSVYFNVLVVSAMLVPDAIITETKKEGVVFHAQILCL